MANTRMNGLTNRPAQRWNSRTQGPNYLKPCSRIPICLAILDATSKWYSPALYIRVHTQLMVAQTLTVPPRFSVVFSDPKKKPLSASSMMSHWGRLDAEFFDAGTAQG